VPPTPAGQQVPVVGPHAGNGAHQAPAPVLDVDGPEPGSSYPPAGADAAGTGATFRAQYGNEGPRIKALQMELNRDLPLYAQIVEDGVYGAETAGVLQDFARRVAADPNCPPECRDGLANAHGDNVGPNLARVLPLYGVQV
jgi:peptidoglycan hydrolase-like protein with peptidoglycan-binding domain